jgi:hypothetical protein
MKQGTERREEDAGSYWMALRKLEDTGNWKKHYIALCGQSLWKRLDYRMNEF